MVTLCPCCSRAGSTRWSVVATSRAGCRRPAAAGGVPDRRRAGGWSGRADVRDLVGLELRPCRCVTPPTLWACCAPARAPRPGRRLDTPTCSPPRPTPDDPLGFPRRDRAAGASDEDFDARSSSTTPPATSAGGPSRMTRWLPGAGWAALIEPGRLRRRCVDHLRAHPTGWTRGCRPDHSRRARWCRRRHDAVLLPTWHGEGAGVGSSSAVTGSTRQSTSRACARRGARGVRARAGARPGAVPAMATPRCPSAALYGDVHLDVRFVAVVAPPGRSGDERESIDVRWWPVDALPDLPGGRPRPGRVEAGARPAPVFSPARRWAAVQAPPTHQPIR